MLGRRRGHQLLASATVFVCPSVYEPSACLVNLEAIACETAVVATATGGIPEVRQRRDGLQDPSERRLRRSA